MNLTSKKTGGGVVFQVTLPSEPNQDQYRGTILEVNAWIRKDPSKFCKVNPKCIRVAQVKY